MNQAELMEKPDEATELALSRGYANMTFISLSPGSVKEIRDYVHKFNPDAIVVDQIRNVAVSGVQATALTDVLNYGAQATRAIAKEYDLVSILITQAGDSADMSKAERIFRFASLPFTSVTIFFSTFSNAFFISFLLL